MKTVRGMHAAYQPYWMREPEEYTAQVTHDDKARILIIELPGNGRVALPADQLRSMLNDIEGRKNE